MKYTSLSLATTFIALLFTPHLMAADEAPSVSLTKLSGPLHLLQGRGGNVVASVGDDGILMVDDDYADTAPAFRDVLKTLAGDDYKPRFLLNTHWHGDHVGGNLLWSQEGAVLMAHDNVRRRMSTRQEMAVFDNVVEPSPPAALPVVTYGDALTLHFNGDDVEVQHFPRGHTDGDSVVFFSRENTVHMGDLFFKDAFPFVDIGSGGNVFGYIEAVEAILERVDTSTVIVPGHGSLADKADLLRYHHMLTTTAAVVKTGLASGMTVEQLTQKGLGEEWQSWGEGFINEALWISFVAGSL
tara:strand:- start:18973 stop:19866 length:894 start_codon:yes stop_codon:yes gene_type:complete